MRTIEPLQPQTTPEAIQLIDRLNEAVHDVKTRHAELLRELKPLYRAVCAVRKEEEPLTLRAKLETLAETVRAYRRHLVTHAEWERSELFPLAVWYFGNDMDVFTLMDHEEQLAERYIDAFLAQYGRTGRAVTHEEALRLASNLLQAYALLTNHFKEEEEILEAFADQSNGFGF